jgi:hypothetical protein
MVESFLAFIGYEAMSGWQKIALFAIVVFLIAQIIRAIEGLARFIYYLFYPAFERKPKDKQKIADYSSQYANVRLSDNLFLEVAGYGDGGSKWTDPPRAVGISLDYERVIDHRYVSDFLGALCAYLKGDMQSDKEYRIGEKLIAKATEERETRDNDGTMRSPAFRRSLTLYANGKEYSYDDYQIGVIRTALKESLRKCNFVGLYGLVSYGSGG